MNVLIVDDSVVFRMAISTGLSKVPGIKVQGAVSNGQLALDFLKSRQDIDLMILDMEMPVLNGIDTIKELRKVNKKIIIIVFSSLTLNGAELTLNALSLGANDFVTKQEASSAVNLEASLKMIEATLVPKINAFESVLKRGKRNSFDVKENVVSEKPVDNNSEKSLIVDVDLCLNDMPVPPKLLVIASSTGGPDALNFIVKNILHNVNIPVLLVQHMPPIFTEKLAQMLDRHNSHIVIKEAVDKESIKAGVCYVAPGDYHMTITKNLKIKLNQDEKVSFVRPSATVLFESVEQNFMGKTLAVVLTGMGDDGARGLEKLVNRGDYAYIQDEATCIVWGMPGAARAKCPHIKELPLQNIPLMLNKVFENIS